MDAQPCRNEALGRYELSRGGATAFLEYEEAGEGLVVFTHTFVPEALRGGGVAAELTRFALDDARARGRKVVPRCSYTDTFMRRHREYADLRADGDEAATGAPACGLPRAQG